MAVLLQSIEKNKKMKFKNIFKNKSTMTTDNTEIDQELDEVTLDNNANEEQAIAEELSVEEQMALDLANEKDKYLRLFAEFG